MDSVGCSAHNISQTYSCSGVDARKEQEHADPEIENLTLGALLRIAQKIKGGLLRRASVAHNLVMHTRRANIMHNSTYSQTCAAFAHA